MQVYFLRRSRIDSQFVEIVKGDLVIEELKFPTTIQKFPRGFPSKEELLFWIDETIKKQIKILAYRLLNRKNYSKNSLSQKLIEKGFSSQFCEKIIDELEKMGYLSDQDYAETLIRQKMRQGYGPSYIERYLQGKGLDPHQNRIDMDSETQKESIQKWLIKCRGKNRNQIFLFLLRRGFDLDVIKEAIKSFN